MLSRVAHGLDMPDLDMEDPRRRRAVYDAMAYGVVITDASGTVVDANDAAQRLVGLSLSALCGHSLAEAYRDPVRRDGSAISLADRPSADAAHTDPIPCCEIVGMTGIDGRRRWLQVETMPLRDDDGQARYSVSSLADITARIQAEQALHTSEELFRLLSEHASDLLRIVQGDGTILYASPSHRRILGYAPADLLGRPSFDFVHPDDLGRMLAEFNAAVERGDAVITSTYRVRYADGSWRVIEVTATDHLADPVLRGLVVNGRDITQRVAAEEALRRSEDRFRTLAHHDTLTGLPNRVLFQDRLARALADARGHEHSAALLFLDLDGFKAINDTHGHDAGDLLLRLVAQRLRGCVRDGDTVARLGGDEFTLLLPDIRSAQNAAVVARKILDDLTAPVTVAGHSVQVTASIGVGLYPSDGADADVLLHNADLAMYRAKSRGKNTIAFFEGHG